MPATNQSIVLPSRQTFSIVIPCHNRAWCIERAISSAVKFLKNQNGSEIFVVDDGSNDETSNVVMSTFEKLRESNVGTKLILIKHDRNLGVCAAKNTGSRAATGDWLIFLDSDDELIEESFADMQSSLNSSAAFPLHFFRCVNGNSKVDSISLKTEKRSFSSYLKSGTDGETLPVIKKSIFDQYPYDEDIPGYESLSYMRIASAYEYICIHDVIVRRYHIAHSDRLSAVKNFKARSGKLAEGHLRAISEHRSRMSFVVFAKFVLKFLKMKIISIQ